MNILWLSHIVPYPPKGGSLQRSYNLLRETAKVNRVFLLAFNQKVLLPTEKLVKESVEKLNEICEQVDVFDVPCERSKLTWYWLLFKNLFSTLPYSVKRLQSRQMEEALNKMIVSQQIDVVYFDTIDLAQYTTFVRGLKLIMNHHNVESMLLLRRAHAVGNPLKKFYLRIQSKKLREYENETIESVGLNLAVSEIDKKELERLSPRANVAIISNGVDTDYFYVQDLPTRKNNLVFIGGMTWYPNRDAVLYFLKEIWPLIESEIPDISFTLIGRQPLKEIVRLSHKKGNIEVLGFVDDVRPYLAQASTFIVPIRIGGGTRLKILDAFACGKAVVSTSMGCEGLEVKAGTNILIGDSPRQFADQVIKVCSDATLMKSLGKEGRKLVEEKYTWKMIGKHLNSLMHDCQGRNDVLLK